MHCHHWAKRSRHRRRRLALCMIMEYAEASLLFSHFIVTEDFAFGMAVEEHLAVHIRCYPPFWGCAVSYCKRSMILGLTSGRQERSTMGEIGWIPSCQEPPLAGIPIATRHGRQYCSNGAIGCSQLRSIQHTLLCLASKLFGGWALMARCFRMTRTAPATRSSLPHSPSSVILEYFFNVLSFPSTFHHRITILGTTSRILILRLPTTCDHPRATAFSIMYLPGELSGDLDKRQTSGSAGYCRDGYGRVYRCRSTWNSWARWLVLGLILAAFIFFFFLCSAITHRRRRKAGRKPYYGTGWVGNTPFGSNPPAYNPNATGAQQQQYGGGGDNTTNKYNTPPQYGNTNAGGGAAQDYYGGQQNGVELQQPTNTYGNNQYAPPGGPPPNKQY